MILEKFKLIQQHDSMDCGPTCLQMICSYYKVPSSISELRQKCSINKEGVSLLGISKAAESIGFRTLGLKLPFNKLKSEAPLPCIIHWEQNHFVVVYKVTKRYIFIADPVGQKIKMTFSQFLAGWAMNGSDSGIILLMEPTPNIKRDISYNEPGEKGIWVLLDYFLNHRKLITQLVVGLLVGSLIQLIFPFLTQSIVDIGIATKDVDFIYLILGAQMMLFLGRTTVEFIRRWILLHLSTRINIALLSDFFIKILKLPLSFFDSRKTGDILQRIEDHSRIQQFLSTSSLSVVFSFFNIIVFGCVLLIYHIPIFAVFLIGSIIYFIYTISFLNQRRRIDIRRFTHQSANHSTILQMLNGINEIKLNGAETLKRWEWEKIQAKLFKVSIQSTRLQQFQEAGGLFVNELKNIIITVMAARAVITGDMTLGMMLASQYIIGQLNAPINETLSLIRQWQDTKLSFGRVREIHNIEDEDKTDFDTSFGETIQNKSIGVKSLSFSYGLSSRPVLNEISLLIPSGKITAIVGTSGSGKTTLLKLLLKVYEPTSGIIDVGKSDLRYINSSNWRSRCGCVMQDGYIFSDTVINNVALGDQNPDPKKVHEACRIACIDSFISELPQGYYSKIGQEGVGLSQGQKQRLLIARAVYKDPEFIFFDEATSSLDANNEREIMHNLNAFFQGRTVMIIAHRLSTVLNADNIFVMEKGKIIESGDHEALVHEKGSYYTLVKNQLELG